MNRDLLNIVIGVVIAVGCLWLKDYSIERADAVTVPNTFSDGSVLTAAQLNSNNTTIYNAFNAHDHDGSDGEPSTLSFTGVDTTVAFSGAINGSGSSALLLDQDNQGVQIGDGTNTGEQILDIRGGTGQDATLRLGPTSASGNWDIRYDDTDDGLDIEHNSTGTVQVSIFGNASGIANLSVDGSITAGAGLALDGNSEIAYETYSGTTCTPSACTTTVDAAPPATLANTLSLNCMVESSTGTKIQCGDFGSKCYAQFASGDYQLGINDLSYDGVAYTCIAIYLK